MCKLSLIYSIISKISLFFKLQMMETGKLSLFFEFNRDMLYLYK